MVLAAVQAVWVAHADQILRFEEVAEGVRNVYWLHHGALYDGISTNVGWYGLLLAAYRVFGFSLYTAKWVRAALHAGALLCLAFLLRRRGNEKNPLGAGLGPGRAAVPLLAAGLSPSILFFNTLEASFGSDLLYLPYLLALLALLPAAGRLGDAMTRLAFWALAMVAWTSYPVFAFYLPALGLAYLAVPGSAGGARGGGRRWPGLEVRSLALAAAGFLLPVAVAAAWLERPGLLFHDPATGSGLFRGGGTGFDLAPSAVAWNVARVLRDLFLRGVSYYYWVERPDLSGPLGLAAFAGVAAGGVWLLRRRPDLRLWVLLAGLLPVVNLLVVSAGEGPQGLRRATSLLAGLYLLYALVWREVSRVPEGRSEGQPRVDWPRVTLAGLLLLLPLHHLGAAAVNYPRLPWAGAEQTHLWLRIAPTARESVDLWLRRTGSGRPLDCRELDLEPERCQYGGIYGLLRGSRLWNGEEPPVLRGWDYESGGYERLSVDRLSGEFSP